MQRHPVPQTIKWLLCACALAMMACPESVVYIPSNSPPIEDESLEGEDSGIFIQNENETNFEYETCVLDGVDDLTSEEYSIQAQDSQCQSGICIHYNLKTFCTYRCEINEDCSDNVHGLCEFRIYAGDHELRGSYCVPIAASRQ